MAHSSRKQLLRFAQDCIRALKAGDNCPPMPSSWSYCPKPGKTKATWNWAYRRLLGSWQELGGSLSAGQEFWAVKQDYDEFKPGNIKLPFWAFSTLPIITCPGMGACGITATGKFGFCYSLKAIRYPHAFMRQLVNTLRLLTTAGRQQLAAAFHSLPIGSTVRLYVDGDIDSKETLRFWFGLVAARQDLAVYGYSKSWQLFLDWQASGREFPSNYILNLSSGSRYDDAMLDRMRQLPIVRGHDTDIVGAGEFLAVKSTVKMPHGDTAAEIKADSNWAAYSASIRQAAAKMGMGKVWVCPGKCGDCMPGGEHACGTAKISLPIIIGLH
jgi:hypothetical protein